MALFKRGSKAPKGVGSRPATGAVPEGGYGSGPVPGRAQKTSAIKNKPEGGGGSYGQKHSWQQDTKGRMKSYANRGKPVATKPVGGMGSHTNKPQVRMGAYKGDGKAAPSTPVPKDQKSGRFNLPRGKFTY